MKIKTPEEFVHKQPVEYHGHIEKIRDVIKETIPIAEEIISFQAICYKYNYLLVGIGTKKGNCSLYIMHSKVIKEFEEELKDFEHTDSTIYFPIDKPLPIDLIKELVQERIIENEQRLDLKRLNI